jgi:hypothetical protein
MKALNGIHLPAHYRILHTGDSSQNPRGLQHTSTTFKSFEAHVKFIMLDEAILLKSLCVITLISRNGKEQTIWLVGIQGLAALS